MTVPRPPVTQADVAAAGDRLGDRVRRTPVIRVEANQLTRSHPALWLKLGRLVGDPLADRVPAPRLGSMTEDLPRTRKARFDLLLQGGLTGTDGGVSSSCSLVRDGARIIVVDPGMAPSQAAILGPLRSLGVEPGDVTDVVLGHHHPDHTLNAALFPNAAVHDHWATYRGTDWQDADADGRELTPSVRLLRTPGHTAEDISTVVGTPDGIVVLTHIWFTAEGPAEDPTAEDAEALAASRARILGIADHVIPGHGRRFVPGAATPR